MKRTLMKLYKIFILPIFFFFSFFLLVFVSAAFVIAKINSRELSITYNAVHDLIFLVGISTLVFSIPIVIIAGLIFSLERLAPIGKKSVKRMGTETLYNIQPILRFTSVPVFAICFTFVILTYSTSDGLYGLITLVFALVFILLASIGEGILGEKDKAIFLLRRFSEDIKANVKKTGSSFPNSREFLKGLKTFDRTLPGATHLPSKDRRLLQVELVLFFGDKKELSKLSSNILAVAECMEKEHLEGFDKEYRNLTEFLDGFENEMKGVVELAERMSLREKMKKQSGEVLKEILVKTIPFLIAILISILIWMWLGIRPELPI